MTIGGVSEVRAATSRDAAALARLLDAFNREFDVPTPGEPVLAARLSRLLPGDASQASPATQSTLALLAGSPPVGLALLTLRPNVWFDGPVGLLDELYVVPERRSQGIGAALLSAAETALRERDGELLEINVDGADVDARRFYERHGYTCIDTGQLEPSLYYYRQL